MLIDQIMKNKIAYRNLGTIFHVLPWSVSAEYPLPGFLLLYIGVK